MCVQALGPGGRNRATRPATKVAMKPLPPISERGGEGADGDAEHTRVAGSHARPSIPRAEARLDQPTGAAQPTASPTPHAVADLLGGEGQPRAGAGELVVVGRQGDEQGDGRAGRCRR